MLHVLRAENATAAHQVTVRNQRRRPRQLSGGNILRPLLHESAAKNPMHCPSHSCWVPFRCPFLGSMSPPVVGACVAMVRVTYWQGAIAMMTRRQW